MIQLEGEGEGEDKRDEETNQPNKKLDLSTSIQWCINRNYRSTGA